MLKVLSRTTLSLTVVANLFLGSILVSNHAEAAAQSCRVTFQRMETEATDRSGFYLTKIKGADKLTFKPAVRTKMKEIFDRHDMVLGDATLVEAIEGAVEKIRGRTKAPSIAKADKMAKLSREMLEVLKESYTKKQYLLANYLMAEATLRLETIKFSEFKDEAQAPAEFSQSNVLPIGEFNRHVESYIDGTSLYADLSGPGGIIAWPTIRTLYSNNNWIIALKNHDMYHLHYSYGHPYYLAVNLQSSRTINDRRYYIISALWESVDTFRTGFESGIANYINQKGMSPQEGMLFLATASEAELTAIEAQIGKSENDYSFRELSYKHGWRPFKSKRHRGDEELNERTYLAEIETYVNSALANMSKATNKKYVNYSRAGAGRTSAVDEDRVAGYN